MTNIHYISDVLLKRENFHHQKVLFGPYNTQPLLSIPVVGDSHHASSFVFKSFKLLPTYNLQKSHLIFAHYEHTSWPVPLCTRQVSPCTSFLSRQT